MFCKNGNIAERAGLTQFEYFPRKKKCFNKPASPNWQSTQGASEELSACLNLSHSSPFSARGLLCRSKDRQRSFHLLHPSFSFHATLLRGALPLGGKSPRAPFCPDPSFLTQVHLGSSTLFLPLLSDTLGVFTLSALPSPPLPLLVRQFLLRLFSLPPAVGCVGTKRFNLCACAC